LPGDNIFFASLTINNNRNNGFLQLSEINEIICSTFTPEALHTVRGEETTHVNSRIIITAAVGVPLSTVPSAILFDVWFLFYIRTDI